MSTHENGTKKLLDLQAEDKIDVEFDSGDDIYFVGDIVGAYDSVTDISVAAEHAGKSVGEFKKLLEEKAE